MVEVGKNVGMVSFSSNILLGMVGTAGSLTGSEEGELVGLMAAPKTQRLKVNGFESTVLLKSKCLSAFLS